MYLARIPLIYLSFSHIVAVLLAELSDLIGLDFSGECEKMPGLSAQVEGSQMSGFPGCQSWLSPQPEEPGTRALVGKVGFGQAFSWALLGAAPLVTAGGFPSAVGKEIPS